jgi:GNAT superfamily N-acetyltransferase
VDITIREARLEDSYAITAILRSLGWSDHMTQEGFSAAQAEIMERLESSLNEYPHTILVAERQLQDAHARQVVGYASVHWYAHLMHGSDGYVSELFVHPDMTGHGIGGRLLSTIETYARERGCSRLLLMNRRIRESYARKFYAKHGWEEMGDAAFFSRVLSTTTSL